MKWFDGKPWLLALCVALTLPACGKSAGTDDQAKATPTAAEPAAPAAPAKEAAPPPVTAAEATAEAKQFFDQVCVVCHGSTGNGDGVGAANLTPKPRAFGDKEWQASVTDEHLHKVILSGGMAVGKSPIMPGNPQLKTKPEVLAALVAMVRSFGK